MPGTRLVRTQKGGAFELSTKRRLQQFSEKTEGFLADGR